MTGQPPHGADNLRSKAERKLDGFPPNPADLSPEQVSELLHELQVHQLELEIQNDELREAQRSLGESRDWFLTLFHKAPVGYLVLDRQGMVRRVNDTFCRMLGRDPKEVLGRSLAEFMDQEHRELFLSRFRAFSRNPVGKSLESFFERAHREGFFARMEGTVLAAEDGRSPEACHDRLLLTASDITAQRRAEESLRRSESEKSLILDSSNEMFTYYDRELRVLWANRATAQSLGADPRQLTGRHCHDLWFQRDEPCFDCPVVKARETKERQEGEIVMAKGRVWHLRCYPILDERNQVVAMASFGQDITERKKLEEQLRHSQKMEAIGTLAGGIAHDFNNILAAILGYAELGAEAARRGQDVSRDLGQIMRAALRGRDLVRQILAFSRREEPRLGPVDLNAVVAQAAEVLRRTLSKMVSVVIAPGHDLLKVNGDAAQLELVLFNLCTNAADAMPEGGSLILETRNLDPADRDSGQGTEQPQVNYVVLQVTDTGTGMDQAVCERIFDPFFTTKEVGKGTGLGLAIVYGIVKGHGGHIYCHSEPGRGTAFKLFLPAYHHLSSDSDSDQALAESALGGHESLLLVDDDPALLQMGARVLTNHGYRVITANNGEEALVIYEGLMPQPPDLVILDLGMPGMGGRKCLKALHAVNPRAKVVVASAYAVDDQIKTALELGAQGFVAKPFRQSDLLRAAREVLDRG